MCLNDFSKISKSSLLILLIIFFTFKSNLTNCDIVTKNSTNSENHTSSVIQCSNSTNDGEHEECILRDHHVVIVKKMDSFLNEPSSIYSSYNEHLKHTSLLYGIALLAQENELNQKCYNEIMQIYDGINRKEIWAMKSKLQHTLSR